MCSEQNEKDSVDINKEADDLWDSIKEPVQKMVDALNCFAEQIKTVIQPILDAWKPVIELVKVKHKKIYHLAVHGRTERIRKKNRKRLFEILFGKKGAFYGQGLVRKSK